MNLQDQSVLVTGGASGLGLASARAAVELGKGDLPSSAGAQVAADLGERVTFIPTDVTVPEQVAAAVAVEAQRALIRGLVHTAGRGGPVRVLDRDGKPGR